MLILFCVPRANNVDMCFLSLPPGIIQTFNFADNGRHLANQNYRSCVRQEKGLCSIQYEPCNDQSFRIGPMPGNRPGAGMPGGMPGLGGKLSRIMINFVITSFILQQPRQTERHWPTVEH